jgi:hypothetical protein
MGVGTLMSCSVSNNKHMLRKWVLFFVKTLCVLIDQIVIKIILQLIK